MAKNRTGRINDEIQKELSALLRNLKDPRVQKSLLSITAVDTTPDLRQAKVYVSVLDKELAAEVLKGLKSSAGFLRRELGRSLALRHTPELNFIEDHSIDHASKILTLLNELD